MWNKATPTYTRANYPVHRIAARERFWATMKRHSWAAAAEAEALAVNREGRYILSTQEPVTTPTTPPPFVALFQMVTGYYVSQALYVAAKLGIADLLKDGPRHYTTLAQLTGIHAPSLYRLLRLLASAGVCDEQEDGQFELTALGAYLQTDIPGSLRAIALQFAGPWHAGGWSDLLYTAYRRARLPLTIALGWASFRI